MKGCLAVLAVFAVVALGEYAALRYTPMSGSIGLPLVSAALIAITVATVWGLAVSARRKRALGVSPGEWRDGAFVGFSGRMVCEGKPVTAIASGDSCSIYEYSVAHRTTVAGSASSDGDTRDLTAFQGMAMAGCSVQGGAYAFRLIGFPVLTRVPKQRWDSDAARRNVAAHLLRTEIAPTPAGVAAAWRSLNEVLADADGVVAFHQASSAAFDLQPYKEKYAADPEGATNALAAHLADEGFWIEETIVPEGAEVTVFGNYRASDRTIDVGSGMKHLERGLSLGDGRSSANRDLRNGLVMLFLFGGACAALARWIGPPLLASASAAPYAGSGVAFDQAIGAAFGSRDASSKLVYLAQSDDWPAVVLLTRLGANPNQPPGEIQPLQQAGSLATVKALVEAGANVDFANEDGTTTLIRFAERGDADTVRYLLSRGAKVDAADRWGNTALARAAVYGRVDVGEALLEAGADPDHRAKDGAAPLDVARAEGNEDFARFLRERGARETEVTADNGRPVVLGEPLVRLLDAYAGALAAHDTASLAVLNRSLEGVDWSRTDWAALLSGRPVRVEKAVGFVSADRATVRVAGPTADGKPRGLTIGFTLSRDPASATAGPLAAYGGWRIEREWIEWGEIKRRAARR